MAYWGYMEDEETKAIKNIEYVKSLYDAQKEKVKNEKYIENLLLKDYVLAIRQNITRYDLIDLFRDAQKELKENAKSKRKNLETLKNFMLDDFLNNDNNFKLTDIIACGYEDYAWAITFEGYNKTFRIDIPIKKKLTTDNIGYANNGMFSFMIKDGNSSWSVLKSSYKIKDISDYIKNYFAWTDEKEEF